MTEEKQQGLRLKPQVEVLAETRQDKVDVRVKELTENNYRRELEAMARDMGFEPTKTDYPTKKALATAIAEKEISPEEEPAEEEEDEP
jgi:hypothetical protein